MPEIAHVGLGEWLVSITAVALSVATLLVFVVTRASARDLRENTHAIEHSNELAIKALENVANNATDDLADVAVAAITHTAPVGTHHHQVPRKIVRKGVSHPASSPVSDK
jgi:hypothetical protein